MSDIPLIKPDNTPGSTQDIKWMNDLTKGAALKDRPQTITGLWTFNQNITIPDGNIGTNQLANNSVTNTKLRDSAGLSVIGKIGNTTGDPEDIIASVDGNVLRRAGASIGFGQMNLASGAAVTGILPVAQGGTGVNNATIAFGTYTPTLFNTTNVAASTAYSCHYVRVGTVVTVGGFVEIDPTLAAPTNTLLGFSLPIASNIGATQDIGGTMASTSTEQVGGIYGDATNDRAIFRYQATSTANIGFHFTFTYRII